MDDSQWRYIDTRTYTGSMRFLLDGRYRKAVIISNALHIMPSPELVLENIRNVLKPDGLLIAPAFSHGHLRESTWNLNARILKLIGFETYAKWFPEEYVAFINQHGFSVKNWRILKAAFPLVYLEARLDDKSR